MDDKELHEIALFRFSLISPIVNETFLAVSQMQYFRDMASKTHKFPNGKEVKFNYSTIKRWYLTYKNKGFDALIPRKRSDLGRTRVINQDALKRILELKQAFPHITGTLVYKKLIGEGYVRGNSPSMSSVLKFIRDNNLKPSQLNEVERRAYEMPYANDCWQADTSHGATIRINDVKQKTYIISIIDDASRLVLHLECFTEDNSINFQSALKKAINKYGVPKKLFVDNGGTYRNDQLSLICASLGIALIHCRPYSGASKGKIERLFRTLKDGWLNGVDWNLFDSLESLSSELNKFLNENYTNVKHSGIDMTPRERYLKDISRIKQLPKEVVEEHFLHRITRKVNNDATIQINKIVYEAPQKYIGQRINIRYLPNNLDTAYIFDQNNNKIDTIHLLNKIDNSMIKRKTYDYSKLVEVKKNV